MSRLMSVSHTADAVIARRKTVTRRLGWKFLQPGDTLTLCRKVMGRKPGEPLERLAEVEVVSVRREPLHRMDLADIVAEGVPAEEWLTHARSKDESLTDAWVRWFAETMGCEPDTEITRIEWRYLDERSQENNT